MNWKLKLESISKEESFVYEAKVKVIQRLINPWNLLEMWTPVMGPTRTFTVPGIKGRIKNAANNRAIKKNQRRRAYLKMCRS